jgi:hypothetical protein
MLTNALAAEKPTLSTLRERLLTNRLAQVEEALAVKNDELQTQLRFGLSPAKLDQKQFELEALRDFRENLKHGLETVARQALAYQAPSDEEEEEPIQRMGPWRLERAYLDNLQRERAKLAPLSREQWVLAKETSAKRSRRGRPVDLNSQDVLRKQHPTWFTNNMAVPSYMFAKETLTGVDPCIEQKKVRREVMFAQRTAGIGYRTRHEWKPC